MPSITKIRSCFGARCLIRGTNALVFMVAAAVAFAPSTAWAGAFDDFFKAAKLDDARTVQNLIRRGLDPNLVEAERGDTAMILALREDSMKVFEVLLKAPEIDLDAMAGNGDTALMLAAYKGNLPAVEALLARDVVVNRPGWTALHYAAATGNNAIAQLLLDRSAYIDAESPNGTTPIMMAAKNGHIYTVKLLLDSGADATLKNQSGMTAIDFAAKFEHHDIAEGLAWQLKKAGKL